MKIRKLFGKAKEKSKAGISKARKVGKSYGRTAKAMGKLATKKTTKAVKKADSRNTSMFRSKKKKAGKGGWY